LPVLQEQISSLDKEKGLIEQRASFIDQELAEVRMSVAIFLPLIFLY
jgi:hypothetical protein